jgi:hypothetical protein
MQRPPSIDPSTPAERVLHQGLALPDETRFVVATELLASLDGTEEQLDDEAWLGEICRRAERVERGESRAVTWDEAKRSALDRLRAR